MTKVDDHLVRCFSSVFPTLTIEEIRTASVETVSDWDSLASVILTGVIEQEFGVEIGLSDLQELVSFEAIQRYLDEHKAALSLASTPSEGAGSEAPPRMED